jgi:ribosome-interacting GTPase 1
MDCFRICRWLGLNENKRLLNISSQRLLKARLAKLRREVLTPKSGGGGPGEGFDVAKTEMPVLGLLVNPIIDPQ